jgi:tRNA(Ile)-lysidine synthase
MRLTDKFIDKTAGAIHKYSMLAGGETVLIGLSGGPDSVCLLHVLHALKSKFSLNIHAVYVDHGLRPGETPGEIEFCEKICSSLSVPFVAKVINVKNHALQNGLNKQEAARELRYSAFEETAHETNAQKIALGHTADDQAETLLMRLLRGSGTTGLAGIPPIRKSIIRPLIEIEREEIERFLHTKNISFIVDSSNLNDTYLRNKIRLSLMPLIKGFNPDIIKTLAKTVAILSEEDKYFELIVTKTLMKLISRKTDNRIELFLSPLEVMDKVILRRVLRRAIEETKSLRGISFIHIEDIIELIKFGNPGDRIYLPKGIRAIKDYSTLILTSEPPVKLNDYHLEIPGDTLLKEAGILIKSYEVASCDPETVRQNFGLWTTSGIFDADKITFPLTARPRKDGDSFYPSGFGRRKKLQDFFVDEKVPRDERARIPLIVSGEDILWVVGYRGDERFRVTKDTKNVLRLEVKKIRD